MAILQKLKSLLGFDDANAERGRDSEVEFDVEHTSDRTPGATDESGAAESTAERETDDASGAVGAPASGSVPDETPDDEASAAEPARDESDDGGESDAIENDSAQAGASDAEPTESTPDSSEGTDETIEAADSDDETLEAGDSDEGAASESEAETPSTTDAEPVDSIKGIGPAYAERLEDAGVGTVDELAAADADALEDETDISATRIQGWIDRAEVR